MGKLHSLKREIKRNPEKFIGIFNINHETHVSWGARRIGKNGLWTVWRGKSHAKFVNKVLRDLGYKVRTW